MKRIAAVIPSLLLTFTVSAQEAVCPFPDDVRKRAAEEVLTAPAVREFAREGRARVLRVTCEVRTKERPEAIAIAYVVSYADGSAMELAFRPGAADRGVARRLPGRVQSSEEEREEARGIIRRTADVPPNAVLEGGFAVDPPEGASPGRYLEFHIATPDRTRIESEVIVDLGRSRIAARQREGGRQ